MKGKHQKFNCVVINDDYIFFVCYIFIFFMYAPLVFTLRILPYLHALRESIPSKLYLTDFISTESFTNSAIILEDIFKDTNDN